MIASQCSFEQMLKVVPLNSTLGIAASFMQVEYGLSELEAAWDGFVDTSDHYQIIFKSRKDICNNFANELSEYIKYLQSEHTALGQEIFEDS